jgi:hypothetical protein
MKKTLFSLLIIVFSCSKENNDCVLLNYEYNVNKKEVYFTFENTTKENLSLLIPNQLSFLLQNKTVEVARLNIHKNVPTYISASLVNKSISKAPSFLLMECYLKQYNINKEEYIKNYKEVDFSILNINAHENKKIFYKLDLDDSIVKVSKENKFEQSIPKMRNLLNNPIFLEVLKMYILSDNTNYKLYLQDYCVKDSLKIEL